MRERTAVFGAGVSGLAAARLAESRGHEVVVFDEAGRGGASEFGEADWGRFDVFVFSPGFAAGHPWRVSAEASGKPCYGEIGYAARHWEGLLYAVTGTNGKTTLTGLLTKAFRQSGVEAVAAGNIGEPFSDFAAGEANAPETVAVCEISSFQAELPLGIRLDGLVWTNFAEDHLDRYASMGEYFTAKTNLFACLKKDAVCVVGHQVAAWMQLFHREFDACTLAYTDPALTARLSPDSPFRRFPHSENFSLAAEFWWMLGRSTGPLLRSANDFQLAAHRLDVAEEWNGVKYWNDSKATNFHATLAALDALEGAVYWIGGGQSKGGDVEAFAAEVAEGIRGAFLYGEVGERLRDALANWVERVQYLPKCEDAIAAASAAAQADAPSQVLFSPGFSSFDQFASYAERGKCFIHKVLGLKEASESR